VAAAATYYISLRTPVATTGKYIHLRPIKILSTANLLAVQVYEDSIFTAGSAATLRNRNRNSPNTALAVFTTAPTGNTDGVLIGQDGAGAAGTANQSGGSAGESQELVLKPATNYLIKFTNIGTVTATTGYYDISFYEEAKG
jgi:hypothetical protein